MTKKVRKCHVCHCRLRSSNKGVACSVHRNEPWEVYFYLSDDFYQLFLSKEELEDFRKAGNEGENVRVIPVRIASNELVIRHQIDRFLVRKDEGDRRLATEFLSFLACLAADFARAERKMEEEKGK